jgi:hypothetical protein
MVLKASQTSIILANQVSLLRASMTGAILVVEGVLDVRLYKKFALPAPHSRAVFAEGKPTLLGAMEILEKRHVEGILGICDADFDKILAAEPRANVVSTDEHDAEIMIACSAALESVLAELSGDAIGAGEVPQVRNELMAIAAEIGRVRLWNKENDARLTFKGVEPGAFLSPGFTFDLDGYIGKVLENGSSQKADLATLLHAAKTHRSQAAVSDLAVGHDFVSLLDSQIEIQSPGGAPGSEMLEKMFRLAFDAACFRQTDLSRKIISWEETTGFEILIEDARPL